MVTQPTSWQVGGAVLAEVDVRHATRDELGAWLVYDRVLSSESPSTPFESSRRAVGCLPSFARLRLFIARDADGSIAGEGRAVMVRTVNGRHLCQVSLSVRADRRRQGIGTALLACLVRVATAARRSLLIGRTSDRVPAGDGFAQAVGGFPVQCGYVNRLRVSGLDRDLVQAWIARGRARAPDYELHFVDGAYPDDLIDAMVQLHGTMTSTPGDKFAGDAPILTAAQIRARERALQARTRRWSLLARYGPTAALIGFTEIGSDPAEPTVVYQRGTIVEPAHRRRGLASWLKAAMIARILSERPEIEEIRTANAASNAPILAINRALGFQPWIVTTAWQAPIARVRDRLASLRYRLPDHRM